MDSLNEDQTRYIRGILFFNYSYSDKETVAILRSFMSNLGKQPLEKTPPILSSGRKSRLQYGGSIIGCCATRSLGGFGCYITGKAIPSGCLSLDDLAEELDHWINYAIREGKSTLVATINTEQANVEPVLLSKGFICNEWAYRDKFLSTYRTGVKVFIKNVLEDNEEAWGTPDTPSLEELRRSGLK